MKHTEKELTPLAKRLLGAMQYGIRIEQDSGHRYIIIDSDADYSPYNKLVEEGVLQKEEGTIILKEYSSVTGALDRIDRWLVKIGYKPLLEEYESFITHNGISAVIGTGEVG